LNYKEFLGVGEGYHKYHTARGYHVKTWKDGGKRIADPLRAGEPSMNAGGSEGVCSFKHPHAARHKTS
jgi:hypothetical protein